MKRLLLLLFITTPIFCKAQKNYLKENFDKLDTMLTMRDGVKLYTIIYSPKDKSQTYPILMERTPYSAGPYGDVYAGGIGPNDSLIKEGYIFVNQDVRGRYRSQGINLEVTPHIAKKKTNKDVDESSDTYDTIDWLIKNTNNNGRVGIHGISYPGFYATASLPDAHPALKAVSPQAPVTDEFMGDDANHNGAFFLLDNFSFMSFFDNQWNAEKKAYNPPNFVMKQRDAYKFFLNMKTTAATNSEKYYAGKGRLWNEYLANDTYNDYWKSRNIRPHLKNIQVPTMVVGGWFDAEDLFGALKTFEAIDKNNPSNKTHLVMGPWTHGAWAGGNWTKYATHQFGTNTSKYYQDNLETSFFNFYLKDKGTFTAAKATIFETGNNVWKTYTQWPPANVKPTPYFLNPNGKFETAIPMNESFSEYLSDPNKPVPYSQWISPRRNGEYMADDQRFAAQRPDVLVFESEELTEDITLSGSIMADLKVSLTGTDADFIVKLIDVLPDTTTKPKDAPAYLNMAGFQRLVRAEVMRGKFRNSFEKPTAFTPNKKETVKFSLPDVAHTFKKGHRIMVQVQSSWFPLVDRNPQQFMTIPKAKEGDYKKATIRIFNESIVVLPVLN